jgi:hypothetical protein
VGREGTPRKRANTITSTANAIASQSIGLPRSKSTKV